MVGNRGGTHWEMWICIEDIAVHIGALWRALLEVTRYTFVARIYKLRIDRLVDRSASG